MVKVAAILSLVLFPSLTLATPTPKFNCLMTNHEVSRVEKIDEHHSKMSIVDDWWVSCTVSDGDRQVWRGDLTLDHPANLTVASEAIEEFRSKKLPKILKELKLQ